MSTGSATATLTSREVTTTEEFERLRPQWNALVQRLDRPSPFHSWEWNFAWWKHFGPGHRLRLVLFERGTEILGIAQLYERRYGPGQLGPSILVPIGWENYRGKIGLGLTEICEFLFPEPDHAGLFMALSDWFAHSRWSGAWIPGVAEGDFLPASIADFRLRTRVVSLHHRDLPGDWEAFISGLNKSMRDNARYYPKLMLRKGHPFSLRIAHSPAELAAALPVMFDLHRSRATARTRIRHDDKFASVKRRAFLAEVIPLLGAGGQFKIGVLEVRGEAVAAQMWLERDQTMFLYYSGYQLDWADYSVATVATLEAFKDGMQRGIRRVEFLRGSGQFKVRWDTVGRTSTNVILARHRRLINLLLGLPRLSRPFLTLTGKKAY